jgi:hypothetical protein
MFRWSDDETGFGGQAAMYNCLGVMATTYSWFNNTDPRIQYIYWYMNQLLINNPGMQPYDEFFFTYAHTPQLTGSSIPAAMAAGNIPQGDFGWNMEGIGSYHTVIII